MVSVMECPISAPSHGVVFRKGKPQNSLGVWKNDSPFH